MYSFAHIKKVSYFLHIFTFTVFYLKFLYQRIVVFLFRILSLYFCLPICLSYLRTDGRTYLPSDGRTYGQTYLQMDGLTIRTDGLTNGLTYGRTYLRTNLLYRRTDLFTDGPTYGRTFLRPDLLTD